MSEIERLAELIRQSHNITLFSGAGMSTESGLPDFRSTGGLWTNNRRFAELASVDALRHDHAEFVAFYRWRISELAKYGPHAGHRVLAKWEHDGRLQGLITQNVDGFHHQAGSQRVHELHGSLRLVRCQACQEEAPAARLLQEPPTCACGGKLRPGVVLFGEQLPRGALGAADRLSRQADLFLVLGSSLLVSPANFFPEQAQAAGAKLVIVNNEPTPLDGLADLIIREPIGEVLSAVEAAL